jgi:PAS domain S-box-containing protein
LPYGIVGGKLFSGFYHGQVTAELAQCILKGEKVQDIPVLIEPQTQYMFNYEQIQRFGIDTSSLPEGSIIINKPYSFYKENKILIWCVIVFIFIQMVIIIILMMNITKRKKAEEELNVSLQHERFWADIVRNASVGVAIGYPDGHFGMCNIAYQKITGYSEKELQTIDWNKTLTPPEWEESETAKLQELHRTKKSVQYEKEYIRKDGSRVPVELLVHSWFDSDGNVECYFTFVIDISDRKQAEDELIKHREHLEEIVKERTAKLGKSQKSLALLLEDVNESRVELDISNKKLETANKELEAFSYSVSHDLRAPLRAIAGFSQIVLEDYQDKLDKEGEEYLNIIHDNTNLMGNLIDDLLRFSRLGRQKTVSSQIKLKAMIKEVFTEQQKLFPGRKIEFNLQKIPNIHGDRAMIRQVITNLISNALKYTEPRKKTQIEFGCQQKKNEMICYIKDNGVGFDMKYKDKLFKVFQRLHSADEFEGTGVGLALIKLIINKHGGTVWAEGKVNKGATFYFSLPSA